MLKAREVVKNLHAYRPPLAGRTGLRLDFNESTVGCSPRVLARLRSLDSELLARYPEREPVEKEVADFLGLDPAHVLLTNGVDEAIHLLCSTYLDPGDEALIVVPTFAMYAIFAQAEGADNGNITIDGGDISKAEKSLAFKKDAKKNYQDDTHCAEAGDGEITRYAAEQRWPANLFYGLIPRMATA